MNKTCSGIILTGGLNTRFSGREKAFIEVNGIRILDRLFPVFRKAFDEIILVTNDPLKYLEWNAHIVSDLFAVRSSLTGIHSGLFYSRTPFAFITACDVPFLRSEVVETIVGAISPEIDVVIPETSAGLEPLCAVYSTRCLNTVARHLSNNKLKIQLVLRRMRVRKISEKTLRRFDPELVSFFNINSPADLEKAEALGVGHSDQDH